MRFTKMQGAGNDYVYVDLFDERVADPAAVARAVSDRHFGVGSDGLILLAPSAVADVRMEMYNADGSRAEMCGNGIRCLAKLAFDRGRSRRNPMRVETDSGVKTIELRFEGERVTAARVDMGVPQFHPDRIPVRLDGDRVVERPIELPGERIPVTCVSMGNPHAVVFVGSVDAQDVARLGPALERHPLFPRRTNVEFVEVVDRGTIRQRTWERGSGETLACGTGACAAGVAAILTGRCDSPLRNLLRGGELGIEWDGAGSVRMTGPAVEVFSGEWRPHGV